MSVAPLKILHLVSGAGERHAGADTRNAGLARGLRALGHEVHLVPLHAPLLLDEPLESDYFRAAPPHAEHNRVPLLMNTARLRLQIAGVSGKRLLRLAGGRWLDHPRLRRWFAPDARHDKPGRRARLALHLLEGIDGPLAAEFIGLLAHYAPLAPDVVLLSNTLLSAFAPAVKSCWPTCPVVGLFAGEDRIVETLARPWRGPARRRLRANVRHYDQLWVTGLHQALRATDLLALPANRARKVPVGFPGRSYAHNAERRRDPFTIGYLSAIVPEKGLATLVRAFTLLVDSRARDARLFIAGRVLDPPYWRGILRQLRRDGLTDRVTVFGELDRAGKIAFLRDLSVFCLPDRSLAAGGVVCLEAMAAGVPVVAPSLGIYPEILRQTGGGILFPPESPAALAESFALLLEDPDTADALARHGQMSALRYYSLERAAAEADEQLRALFPEPPA